MMRRNSLRYLQAEHVYPWPWICIPGTFKFQRLLDNSNRLVKGNMSVMCTFYSILFTGDSMRHYLLAASAIN